MTDTPEQDVRELAIEAARDVTYAGVQLGRAHARAIVGAVLAAVTPVIRQQVAEEIARHLALVAESFRRDGLRAETYEQATYTGHVRGALDEAAAIARSHSTQPETGQDHG